MIIAQCEALIQAIHDRREYLLEAIRMDKDTKIRILKVSKTQKKTNWKGNIKHNLAARNHKIEIKEKFSIQSIRYLRDNFF